MAYTDGACSAAVGGWAYSLNCVEDSGWMPGTTNNQMELYAIVQVVMAVEPDSVVELHTDSRLAIGWLCHDWRRNNEAINHLVWAIRLSCKSKNVRIHYHKVKGHGTDKGNNRVDVLARGQSKIGFGIMRSML
jgi:ribonuclease HI